MIGIFIRGLQVRSLKNATEKIRELKKGTIKPDVNSYSFYNYCGKDIIPFIHTYSKDKNMDMCNYIYNVMINEEEPVRSPTVEYSHVSTAISEGFWREFSRYCNDMADFIKYSKTCENDIEELKEIQKELKNKLGINEEE